MNDIVKNTELFVSILGMSRTDAVQKWDHEAFQRAFRWAHYFEQVHRKTKSKPQVAERIVKHLTEVCSEVDVKLGLAPLTYDDLPNSTAILRDNLIQNPHLSNDFYLKLVGQFNKEVDGSDNFKSQIHSLSKLKATVQILRLIENRFQMLSTKDEEKNSKSGSMEVNNEYAAMKASKLSATKGQITANAILLRKSLLNVFVKEPLPDSKKEQLHAKLRDMIQHERGVDVVLLALVYDEDKKEAINQYFITFVEDVLIPEWKSHWQAFLQLPLSQLLSKCACIHERFKLLYFDLLKFCGDKLQQEIETNDYVLLMGKSNCPANEQMCKYYYFLLQNLLQTLAQISPAIELKVETFIREQCEEIVSDNAGGIDGNVWRKLSHDMMVSSPI